MILDNFSDKLKIAYADILEAMLCQDTREEKDFDEQNRLTERRLYNDEKKLLFREIYDYRHNYVHKKLYPYSEEIVHLTCSGANPKFCTRSLIGICLALNSCSLYKGKLNSRISRPNS